MEKIAQTGAVTLKHAGRSMMVESREDGPTDIEVVADGAERPAQPAPAPRQPGSADGEEEEEAMPPSPMSMQDGIRAVQQAIIQAPTPPRWPMYVRQAKQFLRSAIEGFDERKYGFVSVVDLLRAAGKEGVLRIERDRQGAVRVFPGPSLAVKPTSASQPPIELDETVDVEVPTESIVVPGESSVVADEAVTAEPAEDERPIEEADIIEEDPSDLQPPNLSNESAPLHAAARPRRGGRGRKTAGTRAAKETPAPRVSRGKRPPRVRKRTLPPESGE
jgi:hypothetical protein